MNLNNAKSTTTNYPIPSEGMQCAILTQVVGLGLQPQRPYQGQEKPPAKMVQFTYELYNDIHDFGGDQKPLIISESMQFSGHEKSRLYKRVSGIDPGLRQTGGDLSKMVSTPVMLQIVHQQGKGQNTGRTFANIGAVTPMPKGMPVPQGTFNPCFLYDPYTHDEEVFQKLPQFLKDKINARLDASGAAANTNVKGATNANATTAAVPADSPTIADADDIW